MLDIDMKLPSVLSNLSNVSTIVTHVGTNDTALRQSEVLKEHYKTLLKRLQATRKTIVISGPLPCYGRGDEKWSRLLSLNKWLRELCISKGILFIDNFDLFWERPGFFKRDGLHPNHRGARILSENIENCMTQ